MKSSLKGAAGVKGFLLSHGEKIGMALVVAIAGWMVYASLGQEGETRQPNELTQNVSQTKNRVEAVTWQQYLDADSPEDRPPLAIEWEPMAAAEVPRDAYEFDVTKPVLPPTVLRTDPKLLAAQAVEGNGQTMLMAFLDEDMAEQRALEQARELAERDREREERRNQEQEDPRGRGVRRGRGGGDLARGRGGEFGGERGRGGLSMAGVGRRGGVALTDNERVEEVSYAVVLAKAPGLDQLNIYRNAFQDARGYDPSRDIPEYLGYRVERAEVTPDGQGEWRRVNVRNGLNNVTLPVVTETAIYEYATVDWPQTMPPLVDPRYSHPDLTFPLPPILYREFRPDEVLHSEAPLAADAEAEGMRVAEDESPEEGEGEPALFGPRDDDGRVGRMEGGRMGRDGPMGREFGLEGGRGDFAMEFGGDFGRGGGGRGGRMGGMRMGGGDYFPSADSPFAMIRFLDFSVEPGKRYRYRVQLILRDPNGKGYVSSGYLDKETKARVDQQPDPSPDGPPPMVETDWSEPSPLISVPMAGQVRVVTVSPARGGAEPTAELLVKDFDIGEDRRAMQAETLQERVPRGKVLNYVVKDQLTMKGGVRATLEEVEQFQFDTNITLMDLEGGQKVGGESAPGRVLMMDPAGRLFVRDELSDLSDVELYKAIYEEEDPRDRGRGRGYDDWLDGGGGRRR